ncbi:hypothetical protein JQX13_16670 [Archangium violaceum]|uniref:hypothetical protein n=1 Tax=Archangium violaceum TaxID=83451 RepID=UPI00193C3F0F|nr:hypothetical protein [Archangium violaceum]QRK11557.1 hypothetical protein JQX13_16670 [Archangium violaceum]
MRRLGPPSLLCAAFLLSACRSHPTEPPPTPAPAPESSAASTPGYIRFTGLSLSLLEPVPPERCRWVRLGLEGVRAELFTFDGACERAELAWSHDGSKGAVLLSPHSEAPERAWVVDFASGQGVELALPRPGDTTDLGFDAEGHPIALVSPGMPQEPTQPAVARAFLHDGEGWRLLESKETAYEGEGAGSHVLDATRMLGPTTTLLGPEALPVTREVERGSMDMAALGNAVPSKRSGDNGEWGVAPTASGPLFSWKTYAEEPTSCMPLRWYEGAKLAEPERLALPADACFQLYVRDDVLLVSSAGSARVYDLKQHKRLASADKVLKTRFWPGPRLGPTARTSPP